MKNDKKNDIKDLFLADIKITIDPALNNVSRKGTEKKIAEAKKILAKVNLSELYLIDKSIQ